MDDDFPDALRRSFARAGAAAGGFDPTAFVQQTLARHGLGGAVPAIAPLAPAKEGPARLTHTCAAGSRDYIVQGPDRAARGLVLMLHGCTQSPEDFARGTRMADRAGALGYAVVYPAQCRGANAQTCWNWFSPGDQRADRGEPAILASMVRAVAVERSVPAGRIFVAGLSAGAAMAVILGRTHADLFAAVGAHSGLPYAAARTVPEAFAAMGGTIGAPQTSAPAVPTIVFHGDADATVHPANGARIIADAAGPGAPQIVVDDGTGGGRRYRRETAIDAAGRPVTEHWQVAGLGHAWSGGDSAGSYADRAGPDASAEMLRFFDAQPLRGNRT